MACIDFRGVPVSRYFRTGLYTHLSVEPPHVAESGDTVVHWSYLFRDYGMDHEIEKTFLIRLNQDQRTYLYKDISGYCSDHSNVVDALQWFQGEWKRAESYRECCDAVFDHFWSYNVERFLS
jgi:hypothetical protein